jgi:hypothetical protein
MGVPIQVKKHADVAELADALDSGSSGGNPVEVQVLSSALFTKTKKNKGETRFVYLPSVRQCDPF